MDNSKQEMTLVSKIDNENVVTTLENMSKPLEMFVQINKLPTDNVLASNEEKVKLFNNFSSSIKCLSDDVRMESDYLTKFIVAGAVGLFDGALNYLWDEIIRSLRNKIVLYDLKYFYSIAEQINSQYKKLEGESDLQFISDHDLLQTLNRINILDDYAFNTLCNINYMRNHASAAHPNINELTGIKLASLLEDGIKYAITLEPDSSSITIKQLFDNIRTKAIPDEDFDEICKDIIKIPIERLDDFMVSIFGLYCDYKSDDIVKKNILEISKRIWDNITENTKYKIGSKYGYYRKNGFVEQKDLVNYYLETVGGIKYKDDDSIVADLLDKLSQLKSVHFQMNNFYNEYAYARDIEEALPKNGIPSTIRNDFVKTICLCYVGNGNGYKEGVDEDAVILYKKMIDKFTNSEIKSFILLFRDNEFVIDFGKSKVQRRARNLCEILKAKTSNSDLLEGLQLIIDSSNIQRVSLQTDYERIETKIR